MTRFQGAAVRRAVTDEELRRIAGKLRGRVMTQRALIVVMLVFGVPLLALGPALFATAAYGIGFRAGQIVEWGWWFKLGFVTVLPILFVIEMQTNGKWGEQAAVEYRSDTAIDRVSGYAEGRFIFFMILALLGPGMVLGAWRRIRGQVANAKAPVPRCAWAVAELMRADGGVDVF